MKIKISFLPRKILKLKGQIVNLNSVFICDDGLRWSWSKLLDKTNVLVISSLHSATNPIYQKCINKNDKVYCSLDMNDRDVSRQNFEERALLLALVPGIEIPVLIWVNQHSFSNDIFKIPKKEKKEPEIEWVKI